MIVKENESVVVGTIKVRNLSFHKEVIVRASWNDWQSQEDTFCTYSQVKNKGIAMDWNGHWKFLTKKSFQIVGSSGAYVIYDTFSFKLTLPPSNNRKLEFCVCFRCDGKEYWDNNDVSFYRQQIKFDKRNKIIRINRGKIIQSSNIQPTTRRISRKA